MEEIETREVVQERDIISVTAREEGGNEIYSVSIPKGSNVAETAFGMAVVIKCLVRDHMAESYQDILDMISKYCTDPQYNETVKNE